MHTRRNKYKHKHSLSCSCETYSVIFLCYYRIAKLNDQVIGCGSIETNLLFYPRILFGPSPTAQQAQKFDQTERSFVK